MTGGGIIFFVVPIFVCFFVMFGLIISMRSRIKKIQDFLEKNYSILEILNRKD